MSSKLTYIVMLVLAVTFAQGQGQMDHKNMDHEHCPLMGGQGHDHSHEAGVDKRGDKAMGFRHDLTQHHFRLYADGGAIQVVVKDATDKEQLKAIRSHLAMVAKMFTKGDFSLPMFIHDTDVPGTKNMKKLRSKISYSYSEIPNGGQVLIKTSHSTAIAAIHNFLRFQIKDHRTGDSLQVGKPK